MSDFTAIPCITVIVYTAAASFKAFAGEDKNKFIPAICGILGGILGAACYFFAPECIPGENLIFSIATGIFSGFSATGVNQVYKQLSAAGENSSENNGDK